MFKTIFSLCLLEPASISLSVPQETTLKKKTHQLPHTLTHTLPQCRRRSSSPRLLTHFRSHTCGGVVSFIVLLLFITCHSDTGSCRHTALISLVSFICKSGGTVVTNCPTIFIFKEIQVFQGRFPGLKSSFGHSSPCLRLRASFHFQIGRGD